jgi:hypothetical protein
MPRNRQKVSSLKSLTAASSVVGGKAVTVTATLTRSAPAGGAKVTLAADPVASATCPASVVVPQGALSASFSVTPIASTTAYTVSIYGNYGAGAGVTQHVSISVTPSIPPPPPPPPPPPGGNSLAATLGTPSFADLFAYASPSDAAFTKNWVPQIYSANNYAGAGSNVTMEASNITFPINPSTGAPCLCLTLHQPTSGASNGGEILSAAGLFASTGLGGYGTYEFLVRFGSTSPTPDGAGGAVSGGVSSTFLLSQSNGGTSGYVEIDAPECEGSHPTWAEYDIWFNSDSGGNTEPSGGNFVSQGAGNDSYLNVPSLVTGFNYYGFIWSAGRLDYYLNGVLQGSSTKNVPVPGSGGNIPGIDINHYGCNSSSWGGNATVGTTRYCYVQSAKFWKA